MSEITLLAGFPRSGTTWFANLLNAHSSVIYRHELIGRNSHIFADELYAALKDNFGLQDEQHQEVLRRIALAQVDTDRPPFFRKAYGLLRFPKFHHYAWLSVKALSPLATLYKYLFTLDTEAEVTYLIKETRSLRDFDSMIAGLRASNVIFLVRRPEGAIASHVNGIKKGTMAKIGEKRKQRWFESDAVKASSIRNDLSLPQVLSMGDAEFLSLSWFVYHEELLALLGKYPDAKICIYEQFMQDTHKEVKHLFASLGLSPSAEVSRFIDESTGITTHTESMLSRDASDSYFSVYRDKGFDPDAWKKQLSESEQQLIEKHCSALFSQLVSQSAKESV